VYLALYRHYETSGDIFPGQNVFESTSGSAGISFAAIGRKLGYSCHVVIPAGGGVQLVQISHSAVGCIFGRMVWGGGTPKYHGLI